MCSCSAHSSKMRVCRVAQVRASTHWEGRASPRTADNASLDSPMPPPIRPAVLFVTTVAITLEAFLVTLRRALPRPGLARRCPRQRCDRQRAHRRCLRQPLRRRMEPQSPGALATCSARRPACARSCLRGDYDIVHVHTPIAAFVTRYALRTLPAEQRPVVHLHRARLPLLRGQAPRSQPASTAPWSASRRRGPTTSSPSTARTSTPLASSAASSPSACATSPASASTWTRFASGTVPAEQVARSAQELDVCRRRLHAHDGRRVRAGEAPCPRARRACACREPGRRASCSSARVRSNRSCARRSSRSACSERVRFAGYRRDIPAVLAASDALLLCQRARGAEPLGARGDGGRPPRHRHRHPRHRRRRGPSDAGWIVAKNDVAALAAAIDAAASDPTEAARRGAMARARAAAEFALPRIIDAYEELYREALASRV